jgi:myosin heavy subunit
VDPFPDATHYCQHAGKGRVFRDAVIHGFRDMQILMDEKKQGKGQKAKNSAPTMGPGNVRDPDESRHSRLSKQVIKADWKSVYEVKQRVGVEDMTLLSKLHNEVINSNLRQRFHHDQI